MTARRSNLVPGSIQRVRCFLNVSGRMKVRPWATAGQTLDALHDALLARRADDAFWSGLGPLLDTLARDMRERLAAGNRVVDNEVLDPARRQELLDEIRSALEGRRPGRGAFGALASSLSAPALGLLILVGGVATAGCEAATSLEGDAAADVGPDSADAAVDPAVDTYVDAPVDTAPDPVLDPGCEHEGMTLEQIFDDCHFDADMRAFYVGCIDALHASWRTGLREYFECLPCSQVATDLACLSGMVDYCTFPEEAGEFDLDRFLDNCATIIYLGVRFE
jgi:hypothetical protein